MNSKAFGGSWMKCNVITYSLMSLSDDSLRLTCTTGELLGSRQLVTECADHLCFSINVLQYIPEVVSGENGSAVWLSPRSCIYRHSTSTGTHSHGLDTLEQRFFIARLFGSYQKMICGIEDRTFLSNARDFQDKTTGTRMGCVTCASACFHSYKFLLFP